MSGYMVAMSMRESLDDMLARWTVLPSECLPEIVRLYWSRRDRPVHCAWDMDPSLMAGVRPALRSILQPLVDAHHQTVAVGRPEWFARFGLKHRIAGLEDGEHACVSPCNARFKTSPRMRSPPATQRAPSVFEPWRRLAVNTPTRDHKRTLRMTSHAFAPIRLVLGPRSSRRRPRRRRRVFVSVSRLPSAPRATPIDSATSCCR